MLPSAPLCHTPCVSQTHTAETPPHTPASAGPGSPLRSRWRLQSTNSSRPLSPPLAKLREIPAHPSRRSGNSPVSPRALPPPAPSRCVSHEGYSALRSPEPPHRPGPSAPNRPRSTPHTSPPAVLPSASWNHPGTHSGIPAARQPPPPQPARPGDRDPPRPPPQPGPTPLYAAHFPIPNPACSSRSVRGLHSGRSPPPPPTKKSRSVRSA